MVEVGVLAPNFSAVRPEYIVRPFTDTKSEPVLRPRNPPQAPDPVAFIRWGGPSEFGTTFRDFAKRTYPRQQKKDDEPERKRYNYSEEGRVTGDYRVVNPNDSSQYAIVRHTKQIAFSGPDGSQFTLKMNPTVPGVSEGSGQTPPAPPELSDIE